MNLLYGIIAPYEYTQGDPLSKKYSPALLDATGRAIRDDLVEGLSTHDRRLLACVMTHYCRFTGFGDMLDELDGENTYAAPSTDEPFDAVLRKIAKLDSVVAKLPKELIDELGVATPLDKLAAIAVYLLRRLVR
jgi:hypothetical protein